MALHYLAITNDELFIQPGDPDYLPVYRTTSIGDSKMDAINTNGKKFHLLSMPAEVRCNIYEHVLQYTGFVRIYANYSIAHAVNKDTAALMYTSRLIRCEVKDFFYANQKFEFRSVPATRNFIRKVGTRYAGMVKNVQISTWLLRRHVDLNELVGIFQKSMPSIECVAVPNSWFDYAYEREDPLTKVWHWELTHQGMKLLLAFKLLNISIIYLRRGEGGWPQHVIFAPKEVIFRKESYKDYYSDEGSTDSKTDESSRRIAVKYIEVSMPDEQSMVQLAAEVAAQLRLDAESRREDNVASGGDGEDNTTIADSHE